MTTGLGIGLSVLAGFLCFTLRLFSKARHVETRGFGDAACPPTIMVEGKRAEEEESWSRTSSRSRVYTPGTPLTPSQVRPPFTPSQVRPPLTPSQVTPHPYIAVLQVRRVSTLSGLSVTVQDKDFTVRPVSPGPAGSADPLFPPGIAARALLVNMTFF